MTAEIGGSDTTNTLYASVLKHTENCNMRWTGALCYLIDFPLNHIRPFGLMDKAPDFGSGDCRFESCHGRFLFPFELFFDQHGNLRPWLSLCTSGPIRSPLMMGQKKQETTLETVKCLVSPKGCWRMYQWYRSQVIRDSRTACGS